MKLSAYIITVDSGFAPNPFGHYCTLACCKPTIRRMAEKHDIVVAALRLGPRRNPGHLVYAMRVKEVIPYQKYWRDLRFASRKPSRKTAIRRRGDNIWHLDRTGKWRVCRVLAMTKATASGTSGVLTLSWRRSFSISDVRAIRVPSRFHGMLAQTQGHKNTCDRKMIDRFWDWISNQAPKSGRIDYQSFHGEGMSAPMQ